MGVDEAVGSGDELVRCVPEVFEEFYEREYRGMVRLAVALTGDRLASEDLVQDVFVDAHRRWSRVGAYERPSGWLRRAVINRSQSARRRAAAELRVRARLARSEPHEQELSIEAAEFWAAVRALSRRQAQCIALRYLDGLSVAEIAAVLGCAESTVRVHLHRARAALADRLRVPMEEEDV
jgi:RNA polymerase sigma-70 factor (ECF subfamily)